MDELRLLSKPHKPWHYLSVIGVCAPLILLYTYCGVQQRLQGTTACSDYIVVAGNAWGTITVAMFMLAVIITVQILRLQTVRWNEEHVVVGSGADLRRYPLGDVESVRDRAPPNRAGRWYACLTLRGQDNRTTKVTFSPDPKAIPLFVEAVNAARFAIGRSTIKLT